MNVTAWEFGLDVVQQKWLSLDVLHDLGLDEFCSFGITSVSSLSLNLVLGPTHSQRRSRYVLGKVSDMISPSDGFDPSGLEASQATFLIAGCLSMCLDDSRCLSKMTTSRCLGFLWLDKVKVQFLGWLLTMIMNVRVP